MESRLIFLHQLCIVMEGRRRVDTLGDGCPSASMYGGQIGKSVWLYLRCDAEHVSAEGIDPTLPRKASNVKT